MVFNKKTKFIINYLSVASMVRRSSHKQESNGQFAGGESTKRFVWTQPNPLRRVTRPHDIKIKTSKRIIIKMLKATNKQKDQDTCQIIERSNRHIGKRIIKKRISFSFLNIHDAIVNVYTHCRLVLQPIKKKRKINYLFISFVSSGR